MRMKIKMIPSPIIAAGAAVLAGALILCGLAQFLRAGTIAADPQVLNSFRPLILWGTAINAAMVFLAALIIVKLPAKRSKETESVIGILKSAAEGDYKALLSQDETGSGNPLDEELIGPLRSLGTLLSGAEEMISSIKEMEAALAETGHERKALLGHIHQGIAKISACFHDFEASTAESAEALDHIKSCLDTFNEASRRQSQSMERTEKNLSAAMENMYAVAGKLGQSTNAAVQLQGNIIQGEDRVQTLNGIIKNISKDIEKIADITLTMNQISEQTNILSMNAAIESAHAGAAGAGFAVVADEIRKLAESTKENAHNIREELLSITQKINEALSTSEESSRIFSGISAEVRDFTGGLTEISAEALENSSHKEDFDLSIREIEGVSRQCQDLTAEMAAYHQTFQVMIEQLKTLSGKVREDMGEIDSGARELAENIGRAEQSIGQRTASSAEAETVSLETDGLEASASSGDIEKKEEKPEAPAFTLRTVEDQDRRSFRNDAEDIRIPAETSAGEIKKSDESNAAEAHNDAGEEEYDERGVMVKRPPRTIF